MKIFITILTIISFLLFPIKTAKANPFSAGTFQTIAKDESKNEDKKEIKTVNGKIAPIKSGEKAPFDGVLFDSVAAAEVIVDKQNSEAKCQIETEKKVEEEKAKLNLDIANLRAAVERSMKEKEMQEKVKNDHIKFLEKEAVKNVKKADNGKYWLIGGIAGGVLLTIAAGLIVQRARGNQPIIISQ